MRSDFLLLIQNRLEITSDQLEFSQNCSKFILKEFNEKNFLHSVILHENRFKNQKKLCSG